MAEFMWGCLGPTDKDYAEAMKELDEMEKEMKMEGHPGYIADKVRHTSAEPLSPATKAKYTRDQVYLGMIARFPRAVKEIAKVSVYGSEKHHREMADMSFLTVPDAYRTYTEALSRHLVAEAVEGPKNPQDGGLLHAAQAAWNALARLEVLLRHEEGIDGAYDEPDLTNMKGD